MLEVDVIGVMQLDMGQGFKHLRGRQETRSGVGVERIGRAFGIDQQAGDQAVDGGQGIYLVMGKASLYRVGNGL